MSGVLVLLAPAVRARVVLRGPLGPSDIDPDEVRDLACDATASSTVCNPPGADQDVPDPDLPDLAAPAQGIGLLGQLLVILLVIALVAAIAWLIVRWRHGRIGDDESSADDDLDEEIDETIAPRIVDVESPPERWRRRAAEHRGAARYRESIRCEYRALVGDLARAGYVDEIPGRTTGEERTQVAEIADARGTAGNAVADQFVVAADIFDTAWFDDGIVTSVDDQRFVDAECAVLDGALAGSWRGVGR